MAPVPGRSADGRGHRQRHQVRGAGGDRRPAAPPAGGAGEEREAEQGAGRGQEPQVSQSSGAKTPHNDQSSGGAPKKFYVLSHFSAVFLYQIVSLNSTFFFLVLPDDVFANPVLKLKSAK